MNPSWRDILVETLRGKSLHRILTNTACRSVTLSGKVIDLGARNDQSSYHRFFVREPDAELQYADLHAGAPNVVTIDLEQSFPLSDARFDHVILIHVLEHLLDGRRCLGECARITRPGGQLTAAVPFLYRVHPDPNDYFRYTEAALRAMLKEAGYRKVSIQPLGYGPVTAGVSQYARLFKLKPLVFLAIAAAILLDRLLNQLFPRNGNVRSDFHPLVYFVRALR